MPGARRFPVGTARGSAPRKRSASATPLPELFWSVSPIWSRVRETAWPAPCAWNRTRAFAWPRFSTNVSGRAAYAASARSAPLWSTAGARVCVLEVPHAATTIATTSAVETDRVIRAIACNLPGECAAG